jgi:hypothetical protein
MEKEVIYFTPEDAAKTLPLVKKIVADILAEGKELKNIAEYVEGELTEDPEITKRVSKMQGYIDELYEIGCFYKDWNFEFGLVDFPSVIDGEDVMLCWRSDEETISHYHCADEGFSGRKPIPPEYLGEF